MPVRRARPEIQPAQTRQPDVEHQAAGSVGGFPLKKLHRRTEQFDGETDRTEQGAKRFPYGEVIIHDEDDGAGWQSERPAISDRIHEILSHKPCS